MSSPSILLVDDSRLSRLLVRKILAELRPGWQVREAASGDAALAEVEAAVPDFVSMDLNMPGMSGLEAAARIRIRHPDVKIAILSANIQESVREAVGKAGLGFVAKPVTEASVAEAVGYFEG